MPDGHANLARSTVATAPSPATSGTSLVVATGDGAKFPTPPFNILLWPANQNPTTTNSEYARVDAIATDTFTIVRAQEGSSAVAVDTTYGIANVETKKTFTDLEVDPYIKDEYYSIASDDVLTVKQMSFLDSNLPSGVVAAIGEPLANLTLFPGATTYFLEDPLIVDNGILVDTTGNPATVLWTDTMQTQTVGTLLIIGV